LNNSAPADPYSSWSAAATNIQDAIDVASAGDLILVTNGTYDTGGRLQYGILTNRVAVTKPLTLQSVNGPAVTIISGKGAMRCAYLTNGAALIGLTLTNGATGFDGDQLFDQSGGGVWCESTTALVSNCVIAGNFAVWRGGGAYQGTIFGTTFLSNRVNSAGAGASYATLSRCFLYANDSRGLGGGAYYGALNNCVLVTNITRDLGGGVYGSSCTNCTLVGNRASLVNGGSSYSAMFNCVIYFNQASYGGPNFDGDGSGLSYCCSTPAPAGAGNITNDPAFIDLTAGNLRLQSDSPCINSGANAYVAINTDFDGNPRIKGATVDIGAYEFQSPGSILSYAWAQHYGLPTDGSADFIDLDGDSMNNWQESIAGTDPTNAASVLKMLTPSPTNTPSGLVLTWQSVPTRSYFLQRATSLSPQNFSTISTAIAGQPGTTTFVDTNAPSEPIALYRVGVQ
jgi:hypothetical protein